MKLNRGWWKEKSVRVLTLIVVFPAGGSQRLPRMVGVSLAKELIFTGGPTEWKCADGSGRGAGLYIMRATSVAREACGRADSSGDGSGKQSGGSERGWRRCVQRSTQPGQRDTSAGQKLLLFSFFSHHRPVTSQAILASLPFLRSLQASVALYFFYSSLDACSVCQAATDLEVPMCVGDGTLSALFHPLMLINWNASFVQAPVAVRLAKEAINRGVEVNRVAHHRFNGASLISDWNLPLPGWYEFWDGDREDVLCSGEICLLVP